MLSPDGIVEKFEQKWNQSELPNVMPKPDVVAIGDFVELSMICVYDQHRGCGYARQALKVLTDLCDESRVAIKLVPSRQDSIVPGCSAGLTTEELVAWYSRRGFVETTAAAMTCAR